MEWSEDRMVAFLKHQKALERKRISKQKAMDENRDFDFATVCIGIQSSEVLSDDGVSREGAIDDSASSTAGSASRADVECLITDESASFGSALRDDIDGYMDTKLQSFGSNIVSIINDRFDRLSGCYDNVPNPNTVSAPPSVPVQLSLA